MVLYLILLIVSHESQAFKTGCMIRQANFGGRNLTHCFCLEISRDWARGIILLQRIVNMILKGDLTQSKNIPGVRGILGSYISYESTMKNWAGT